MISKIKVSMSLKHETVSRLKQMAKTLFPVSVSQGDVVDFLVAERAKALGLDRSLVEVLEGDGQVVETEECNG